VLQSLMFISIARVFQGLESLPVLILIAFDNRLTTLSRGTRSAIKGAATHLMSNSAMIKIFSLYILFIVLIKPNRTRLQQVHSRSCPHLYCWLHWLDDVCDSTDPRCPQPQCWLLREWLPALHPSSKSHCQSHNHLLLLILLLHCYYHSFCLLAVPQLLVVFLHRRTRTNRKPCEYSVGWTSDPSGSTSLSWILLSAGRMIL